MYVVALKTDNGGVFVVRCKDLVKDSVVPGNVVLIRCLDPVPTKWGPMETEVWSVNPADIGNYMQGEILVEKAEAPKEDDEQMLEQAEFKE